MGMTLVPSVEEPGYFELRRGRGRPRLTREERMRRKSPVPRVKRPSLDGSHPLHITLRVLHDVPRLRRKSVFKRIRECLRAAKDRFGMRVIQFAVLSNHIHLIVEAENKRSLSRGMQGLEIRVAKAINGASREGKVFRDRYHAVVLETPHQVRNALAYVILNSRHHMRAPTAPRHFDPCSSAYWFEGWSVKVEHLRRATESLLAMGDAPVEKPRTHVLRVGWQKYRLLSPSEVPGPSP